jgi:hypothetical protein
MRAVLIVVLEPRVEISLQLLKRPIDFLPERHAIELVEHRFVKPFADPFVCGGRVFVRVGGFCQSFEQQSTL